MAGVVVSLAVCLLGLLVVYRCLAAWGLRAPGSLARHAVEEGPPAAQGLQPGWKIFLLGAGSRVGLLLAGMVAAMLLSDGGLTWEGAFQQLQRWDAAHYIRLIEEGYQGYTENGQHLFCLLYTSRRGRHGLVHPEYAPGRLRWRHAGRRHHERRGGLHLPRV